MNRLLASVACALLVGCGPDVGGPSPLSELESELVVCAGGPTVQGIDVSIYQGTIDWTKVHAAGKEFAITRIGDGLTHDSTFSGNYAAIKSHGMVRGAYQFFRPNTDPLAQANIAVAAVGALGPGDLPVTIDIEATGTLPSPSVYNQKIHQWVTRVEQGTGKKPIFYVGKYYWSNINTGDFKDYPLWHPQYTTASCPNIANAWSHWKFWQYRGGPSGSIPGGTCAGIKGYVDLDVFNGSLADLKTFAGQATCTPHCEGKIKVSASCGHTDCSSSGSTCVDDALGVRCVFSECPATGERDVCTDDTHLAHCKNGALGSATDCGASSGICSTADAPTGARCVSSTCVASSTEVPAPSEGCWPEGPARISRCDGDGKLTLVPCAAGQQCSVIGGAHCEPARCPDAGTADLCDGDNLAHCENGQVMTGVDCASSGGLCSTAGGSAACVSTECVGGPDEVPRAHATCLPSGWIARCGDDGRISTAEACGDGLTCVQAGEDATCLDTRAARGSTGCGAAGGGAWTLAALGVIAFFSSRRREQMRE